MNINIRGKEMELFVEKARVLYKVQQELKRLTEECDQLKDELKKITNDEGARAGGFQWAYDIRKGTVDYSKIPELKAIDLDQYRKAETKAWKLALYLEE